MSRVYIENPKISDFVFNLLLVYLLNSYSKQAFLADVSMPYDLPDGSPSFKSYVNSKNNRFLNADMASKNRLQPPCKVLHFYNTPPGLTDDDLRKVFDENQVSPPAEIRLLQNKSQSTVLFSLFLLLLKCSHCFLNRREEFVWSPRV